MCVCILLFLFTTADSSLLQLNLVMDGLMVDVCYASRQLVAYSMTVVCFRTEEYLANILQVGDFVRLEKDVLPAEDRTQMSQV